MIDFPEYILKRPFGFESREWMLQQYFRADGREPVTAENAWKHLYRLLLWTDQTTGLAHCYESDKAQPGRHWYQRSLRFHKWLADQLGTTPRGLQSELDFLFRLAIKVLAVSTAHSQVRQTQRAAAQRLPFAAFDMPDPGDDPELELHVSEVLERHFGSPPPEGVVGQVIDLVRSRLIMENKRKNLVGEGFEDALAQVLRRVLAGQGLDVYCRRALHDLPGFRVPPKKEKPRTVDLTLVDNRTGRRSLATVKWSVRADREEQFQVDFDAYSRNEESGRDFDFVFITNEFDAARLASACDRRHIAGSLFTDVVHLNPAGIQMVYGSEPSNSAARLMKHIEAGRLKSLAQWMNKLAAPPT